jgi:hypothetical protein
MIDLDVFINTPGRSPTYRLDQPNVSKIFSAAARGFSAA